MPLGRPTRRIAPVSLAAALALAASAGCNSLPWTNRAPNAAEVKTRVEGDRTKATAREVSPTADRREPTDEKSPLPPAIEGPAPATAPLETPASPPQDETLARADARTPDLIDTLAKDDASRAVFVVSAAPPNPLTPESPKVEDPKPDPTPSDATPAPAPMPPVVEPLPAPAKSPEETWREGVQALRAVTRDRLKETPSGSKPGAANWAVRDRLLGWLTEPDVDTDARSSGEIAQGRAILKGLAALLDPTAAASSRGAEIREAVAALEAEAPLEIADLKPCRMVHGFGNIEPLDPAVRKPGQSVVLYSEINGLAYEPAGPAFRSRIDGKVELIREGSDTPAWSHALPTVEDSCRKRRRDYFIGHKFTLPDDLPPGNYRLRLTQKDLVADHVATRETAIAIVK